MNLVPLSQVCTIVNGGTPKSGVKEYWGGDVAWLTPAEMGKLDRPEIEATVRTITAAGLKNSSAKQVPIGSVIMSTRAPIGHLAIPLAPMAFNQGCRGLVPSDKLDTKFLYYFLWFNREALNDLGTGTTFKELSSGALGAFKIPLWPVEEQRRIVAALDEAFAAIAAATANAEKNLANAWELFESRKAHLFSEGAEGSPIHYLGELCSISRGGSPRPIKAFLTNDPDGVNWIKIGDASASSKYIRRTAEKIRREGRSRSRYVQPGDFLLSNSMSFGRPYIMATDGCIHDGWLVLSDRGSNFDQDYLYHFLGSRAAYQQFDRLAAGSTVRNLNIDLVSGVRVPVPPLDSQRDMARQLEDLSSKLSALNNLIRQKLRELDALKRSLLHRAFSGEPLGSELLAA